MFFYSLTVSPEHLVFSVSEKGPPKQKLKQKLKLEHDVCGFFSLATSLTETETETWMDTLALENIHNTVVKETKPMPMS